jgi:exopolyphosphatase/guanosine-5'-triphosphate,3'-diphosphate pyrophosphatase
MKAAELEAALTLFPQATDFTAGKWDEAIGCSGTIKAIANIVHQQGWCLDGIRHCGWPMRVTGYI